ncbi:murein biosynthesis integral membrane protein MurJ [Caldalkalibacillus mannanilyticus]|uniref:murein biosynthesis integral membrane protein MurJ n=1 Tax=Caldalkalibacillus mannanilyticus TaxID=1418 RepID=UPI00046AE3F9|nr:murein biosynthesis integral membrane protein MurJ [Caldalkalibacillus mannanilyticus]
MSRSDKIVGVAFLLLSVTIVSRLIGFVRQQVIAYYYGTSLEASAFSAAFTIPTLILTITGGALSAALIPMIIRLRNQGEELRNQQMIGTVLSVTSIVTIILSVVLYLFLEPLVNIYVHGYDADGRALVLKMLQIIVPFLIVIGLISLITSILNAYRYYFIPSLGPIFYSTGVIVAALFFAQSYGIVSLMVGMAAGFLAHLVFALSFILKKKISLRPQFVFNEDMKQVGILLFPIFISITVFQLNTLVDRSLGSSVGDEAIAALNYANTIIQLPLSLFVGSMVLPLFPMIADKLSKNDFSGTNHLLANSYRLLGILLLPVMGGFLVLAEPIIAILFQRGEFDAASTRQTSLALMFYAFMLFPFAMRDVMTRAFYSLKDTWTPVINSVIMVAINIGLMLLLVPKLGMIGIAGSTSIASIVAYIRLRHLLRKRIGAFQSEKNSKAWWRILFNTLVFTLTALALYYGLAYFWSNPTGVHLYARTIISFAIAGAIYLYLTFQLETDEVSWLKERIQKLLKKRA